MLRRLGKNHLLLSLLMTVITLVIGGFVVSSQQQKTSLHPLVYQLHARFNTEVQSAANAVAIGPLDAFRGSSSLDLRSTLKVDLQSAGEFIDASFYFQSPIVTVEERTVSRERQRIIEQFFTQVFAARYSKDGVLKSISLEDESSAALVEIFWEIAATLSAHKPENVGETRETEFDAPRRRVREGYRWQDRQRRVLLKTRLAYQDILSARQHDPKTTFWNIVSSDGRCSYENGGEKIFPSDCQRREIVTLSFQGKVLMRGEREIVLGPAARDKSLADASTSPPRAPVLKTMDLSPTSQRLAYRRALALGNTRSFNYQNAVASFKEHAEEGSAWNNEERMAWTERMADYLLLHPEENNDFFEFAKEIGSDNTFFSLLPHTLSVVGSPEAQRVLIDLAKYFKEDNNALFSIISSMLFVERATTDALVFLQDFSEKGVEPAKVTALLAIGKHCGQDDDVGRASYQYLKSRLDQAADDDEKALILSAFGNGGRREAFALIKNYLDAPQASLRAAAVDATRFIDEPQRLGVAFSILESDPSPAVREAAAASLQYQTLPASYLELLPALYTKEKEITVRSQTIKTFTRFCRSLQNCAQRLTELGAAETHPDLKKMIEQEIVRTKRAG